MNRYRWKKDQEVDSEASAQAVVDYLAHSRPTDEEDAAPIVDRLLTATKAGLVDWQRGEMLSIFASVGDVRFDVYFTLDVGDQKRTWRRFDIDVGPLREAINLYLGRPIAAPTSRAVEALDELLRGMA